MARKINEKALNAFKNYCLSNNRKRNNDNTAFLESISETLQELCEKKVSFPKIKQGLLKELGKKIGTSTIKRFCVSKGYYTPKPRTQKEPKSQN